MNSVGPKSRLSRGVYAADQTSLHYADPNAFALVYEAARTALHAVDPSARAVVGGVLDSGDPSLADAERYLRAIGLADAVGYHPYLYDLSAMQQDTLLLRRWLNANGKANVPLDINEFGAFFDPSGTLPGISAWGRAVAKFTAVGPVYTIAARRECAARMVGRQHPGRMPTSGSGRTQASSRPTPLGTAYLAAVKQLTTAGCPAPAAPRPPKRSIGSVAQTVAHSREMESSAQSAIRRPAQAQAAAQALTAYRRVIRLARVRRARTFASTTNSVADSCARSTRWLMPRMAAAWANEPSGPDPFLGPCPAPEKQTSAKQPECGDQRAEQVEASVRQRSAAAGRGRRSR